MTKTRRKIDAALKARIALEALDFPHGLPSARTETNSAPLLPAVREPSGSPATTR